MKHVPARDQGWHEKTKFQSIVRESYCALLVFPRHRELLDAEGDDTLGRLPGQFPLVKRQAGRDMLTPG